MRKIVLRNDHLNLERHTKGKRPVVLSRLQVLTIPATYHLPKYGKVRVRQCQIDRQPTTLRSSGKVA